MLQTKVMLKYGCWQGMSCVSWLSIVSTEYTETDSLMNICALLDAPSPAQTPVVHSVKAANTRPSNFQPCSTAYPQRSVGVEAAAEADISLEWQRSLLLIFWILLKGGHDR
jgi:hypothetical protein